MSVVFCLGVFALQFLRQSDISCHGRFFGLSLLAVPCFPFGFPFQIQHPRLSCVIVADCCLFEQRVQLEEFFVVRTLCEVLDACGSCVKLLETDGN